MGWRNFLFSFRGRFNRAKYWQFVLCYIGAAFAFVAIVFAAETAGGEVAAAALLISAIVFTIPTTIATIAVAVKRLHDRNKTGWWLLLFFLLPAFLSGVAEGISPSAEELSASGLVIMLVALVIGIWGFLEIAVLRGTRGPNAFGPDPLQFSSEPVCSG